MWPEQECIVYDTTGVRHLGVKQLWLEQVLLSMTHWCTPPWFKACVARTRVHCLCHTDVGRLGVMQLWLEQEFIVYEAFDVPHFGAMQLWLEQEYIVYDTTDVRPIGVKHVWQDQECIVYGTLMYATMV